VNRSRFSWEIRERNLDGTEGIFMSRAHLSLHVIMLAFVMMRRSLRENDDTSLERSLPSRTSTVRNDSDFEGSLGIVGGEESRKLVMSDVGVTVLLASRRRGRRRNGATSAGRERRHLPVFSLEGYLFESGSGEVVRVLEPLERNLYVDFLRNEELVNRRG